MSVRVLYVCTGNAARSVMATVMTRDRAMGIEARGAGTLSIPGLPMSSRTRNALRALGHEDPAHRSRQLEVDDALWADVIVTFEPQHVAYVRRHHVDVAHRTATFPRLLRDLPSGSDPLSARLGGLRLGTVDVEPWEEVVDPAGGDQEIFDACAAHISRLVDELVPLLFGGATQAGARS